MNLRQYVERLRRDLVVAADAGGEEARALAERLTGPLESAARLVLLDALSAAADEITRDLAPGSVELRLRSREPGFAVTLPPVEQPAGTEETVAVKGFPQTPPEADDGTTSRVNFRLPEHLKGRIEEAAAKDGLSVNAWLVRTATTAVESTGTAEHRAPRGGKRYTGWVR